VEDVGLDDTTTLLVVEIELELMLVEVEVTATVVVLELEEGIDTVKTVEVEDDEVEDGGGAKVYRSSLPPEPQNWSWLPLQRFLQSDTGASTEPTPSELPQ
jgi:hypothetical protein